MGSYSSYPKENPEWWDYLDWETMELTWKTMPEKMRQKLRDEGIKPSYDSSPTTKTEVK